MKLRQQVHELEKNADTAKLKVKEALNLFDPVIIYPYRGYGNSEKAIVKGRILEKESVVHEGGSETESLWHNLHKVFKRYESDEIPGVKVKGTFQGAEVVAESNSDGYFLMEFALSAEKLSSGWYEGIMEIIEMPFDLKYETSSKFEVLICDQSCEFGIISDVDDTIVKSHASDAVDKLATILTKDAKSRTPFEGVKHLYDALIGTEKRPLFFISGSEYNLYDLLIKFCDHHEICKAPFLLRDLGMDHKKWFKTDTEQYKLKYIEELFDLFPHLSFILIGDSGQQDPEIYKAVAEKFPERVKAIYIRHVDGSNRRHQLEELKNQLNVELLVMDNSEEAMQHASSKGWVKPG